MTIHFPKIDKAPKSVHKFYYQASVPKLKNYGPPNQYLEGTIARKACALPRKSTTADAIRLDNRSHIEFKNECSKEFNSFFRKGSETSSQVL